LACRPVSNKRATKAREKDGNLGIIRDRDRLDPLRILESAS